MEFILKLTQERAYGQIPVGDENGKISYIIKGNLDNPNHTLYLCDYNQVEIGRLYTDGSGVISSFTIDVINHSLVKVKRVNSSLTNLFYITKLNYIVAGSIKNGTYTFRNGFKKVASVKTIMNSSGVILKCNISLPEDIPFILLTTVLLTQWHVTPLRLPNLPKLDRKLSTNPN